MRTIITIESDDQPSIVAASSSPAASPSVPLAAQPDIPVYDAGPAPLDVIVTPEPSASAPIDAQSGGAAPGSA